MKREILLTGAAFDADNIVGVSPPGGVWSGPIAPYSGPNSIGSDGLINLDAYAVGTYTIVYTYTDNNNCTVSDSVDKIIATQADAGQDDAICEDSVLYTLFGYSPTGGIWTGPGIVSGTNTFDPQLAGGPGVYTLTYAYGDSTCRTTDDMDLTVNALPTVDAGSDTGICLNAGTYDLSDQNQQATIPASGGVWSGPGVTGSTFDPDTSNNSGVVIGVNALTYSYTDPATGCINTSTINMEVYGLPVVEAGDTTFLCNTAGATFDADNIVGVSPPGGEWSGPMAPYSGPNSIGSDGLINLDAYAVGTYKILYTYRDNNNCTVSDSVVLEIIAPTQADAGQDDAICEDSVLYTLFGYSPTGGIWTGPGIVSGTNTFDPQLAGGPGVYTLTYAYGDSTCRTTDDMDLMVNALPTIDAGSDTGICLNAGSLSDQTQQTTIPVFGPNTSWSGRVTGARVLTYSYTDETDVLIRVR